MFSSLQWHIFSCVVKAISLSGHVIESLIHFFMLNRVFYRHLLHFLNFLKDFLEINIEKNSFVTFSYLVKLFFLYNFL